MSTLKRYNGTNWETIGGSVTGDTLPIGSEIDYTGSSVPAGWEEVADYSTSEVNTGKKWIDGKHIYRIVFDSPDANYNTPVTTNLGITTIDSIIKIGGFVQRYSAGTSTLSGKYYPILNPYMEVNVEKSTGILTFSINTNYVHFATGKCYIEYTKTTD